MKALFFENKIAKVAMLKVASVFNKNAALGKFSSLRYADIKEPELPNENWLKLKILSCGLCGTDIHFMFMDMDPKCFPAAIPGIERKFLGHELVGEVTQTGSNVQNVKTGDRIAMRIDWPSCNQLEIEPMCKQCESGNYMLCTNVGKKELPLRNLGGGFSPYMVMHKTQAFVVPENMDTDTALLLEPLACAVHGVLKAKPKDGQKVLVIGAGSIGLLTVAALRMLVPDVDTYCLARHPFQKQIAEKLGAKVIDEGSDLYRKVADINGANYNKGYFKNEIMLGGFDVIYDTVGNDNSINSALRFCTGGGTVVIIGINFKPNKIDYTTIWSQEINLTGMNCHATESGDKNSFEIAADFLLQNYIDPADFITHRYKLDDYKQAVLKFMSKGDSKAIKIVIDAND